MKRILGVNRSTTNALVRAELGRLTLKDKCLLRNLNYIKYLNKKDDSKIVKQAFNYEIKNFDKRNTVLKKIAEFNEKLDGTTNRHLNIIKMSSTETKRHIRKISIDEWKSSFQESSKADTYRLFKTIPKMETYLEHFKDIRYIKTLSKFRLSDHKLMIEEGRRVRPRINREDRKCPNCKVIEDEVHFLIDCEKYKKERETAFQAINQFFPTFDSITQSRDKFIFLMSQENVEVTLIITTFIHKSFMIR